MGGAPSNHFFDYSSVPRFGKSVPPAAATIANTVAACAATRADMLHFPLVSFTWLYCCACFPGVLWARFFVMQLAFSVPRFRYATCL